MIKHKGGIQQKRFYIRVGMQQKIFYIRGTRRDIRILPLAEISALFHDWLRLLN